MARKLRLEWEGACYHVINRGNYRRDLFREEDAAEAFERTLLEAADKFGWRLHAFVIMRNHFHLAVETPEPNLSEGMKWLQGTWAMRFNRFRGEAGRPFQGRFKAQHVEPGHALAQVAHYIHLNPLRAGLVTADRLADFRWSSLHRFPQKKRPGVLDPATVLHGSGSLPDRPAGWRRYVAYLGALAEESPAERERLFGDLSLGWCLGSKEFKAGLRKDLLQRGADLERAILLGADPEAWRKEREARWEEKLQRAAKSLRIRLDRLPPAKSALAKVQLAAVMKMATAAGNAWLAERLSMGKPASVSQFVRRFRLRGADRNRRFQAALARAKP
jgi:putative transposase